MIKTLLKSVREYKRDSILAPNFVTLEVIMEVVIPLLMAMLIDKGIDNRYRPCNFMCNFIGFRCIVG